MTIQIMIATACQISEPYGPAMAPKYAPESGASIMDPVIDPTKNLMIHPTTTVYPIAIAKEPTTGISPMYLPILEPRICVAFKNAPLGPDLQKIYMELKM